MGATQWLLDTAYAVLHLKELYNFIFRCCMSLVEVGLVPDFFIRRGIQFLLKQRLNDIYSGTVTDQLARKVAFVEELKQLPLAIHTAEANEQHYEVPSEYFLLCLGRHLKYSSCLYNSPHDTLNDAERNMLELYVTRAELQDGQDVLELGCGWGSLCLHVARRFPRSRVTAVSNSRTQRHLILARAQQEGITNLQVLTANVVEWQASGTYDRILSVEMLEHFKNYHELLRRISTWLRPDGKLFVHIFLHKHMPYHFEDHGEDDWMTRYFFTGGTMPSLDLLLYFQDHLALRQHWYVSGTHYSRSLEAWLRNQDANRAAIMPIFANTYGKANARKWFVYWRLFYLACSELFNWGNGEQWGVGHFLFENRSLMQ